MTALQPLNSWLLVRPIVEKIASGTTGDSRGGIGRGEVLAISDDLFESDDRGVPETVALGYGTGDVVLFPLAKAIAVTARFPGAPHPAPAASVDEVLVDADDLYAVERKR